MIFRIFKQWMSDRKKRNEIIENENLIRRNKKIAEMEAFAQPGDRFWYLDYHMLCVAVGYLPPYYEGPPTVCMLAECANPVTGKVEKYVFYYHQLPILIKEKEYYERHT